MANETVLFKRGDSATITSTPITDGQILFDTSGNGKMYLDNGTDRLEMGGAITVDASLSKTSTNAIQNKAVTGNILNSLAEVSAATQQNTIAGALALKEVNSSLNKCFPDFSNVLDSTTLKTAGASYFATENCYVCGLITSTVTTHANVYIDDVVVANHVKGSVAGAGNRILIPVSKGSTVSTREGSDYSYDLTVYGTK